MIELASDWASDGPAGRPWTTNWPRWGRNRPCPRTPCRGWTASTAALKKCQGQLERLGRQRGELRSEDRRLGVNDALRRQAARIEALLEQEPWIEAVQGQVGGLEKEIADTTAAIAAEHKRLGLEGDGPLVLPSLSPRGMALLRSASRAMHPCRQRLAQARQAVAAAEDGARSLASQSKRP